MGKVRTLLCLLQQRTVTSYGSFSTSKFLTFHSTLSSRPIYQTLLFEFSRVLFRDYNSRRGRPWRFSHVELDRGWRQCPIITHKRYVDQPQVYRTSCINAVFQMLRSQVSGQNIAKRALRFFLGHHHPRLSTYHYVTPLCT